MARPKGTKSPNYDARRDGLLARVAAYLVRVYPARPSFREIAAACDVSQPTLRHYFGSREGLIAAHFERYGQQGSPYLARLAVTELPLRASLQEMARTILDGFTKPHVGTSQAVALSEGLAASESGPEYLAHVLEPTLQAVASRLRVHIARGEMRPCDPRFVATLLVSPILVAALHQDHLGGKSCFPLDVQALADESGDAIAQAYGAVP